jgi:hypothetical protein
MASALPMAGRAATITIWPPCSPFVRSSSSANPVGTPAIAPSGLTFYTGDRFPKWKGDVFVGSLRTGEIPGTGHLERILFNEKMEELRRESLLVELRQRTSPGQMAHQVIDYVREGPAAEFLRNVGREVRENPLPLMLIGAGCLVGTR